MNSESYCSSCHLNFPICIVTGKPIIEVIQNIIIHIITLIIILYFFFSTIYSYFIFSYVIVLLFII